jgi:hypothetical protein
LDCIVIWTLHYKTRYQLIFHWNNNTFDQFRPLANAIIQTFTIVRIPRKMILTTFISKEHTFTLKIPSYWDETSGTFSVFSLILLSPQSARE